MAYFALLWKARIIEKCRLKYENEKLNSIMTSSTRIPGKTLSQSQRWRIYRFGTQRKIRKTFRRWFPEGSSLSNILVYLGTDQSFPKFLLKSFLGFLGGVLLTYLCFIFFVCQLAISLIHATVLSSVIGVMLTLGLAFSSRARCLVFLLIPQLFSRVGRYTLTCYALVLILTGPATNTLKNSQVLTESMACAQEQIKSKITQMSHTEQQPQILLKHSMKTMVDSVKTVAEEIKDILIKTRRIVLNIVDVIQSSFIYLDSVISSCNKDTGTPYQRCLNALGDGIKYCKRKHNHHLCNSSQVEKQVCEPYKSVDRTCVPLKYVQTGFIATMKRRFKTFSDRIKAMVSLGITIKRSESFSSNNSHSSSQITAGIITEIRHKADPLLTWISWSSCVTSLFFVLVISRAKTYQNMFETRSRFDNRYVTKQLRDLDLKRQRQNRETVLPLNRLERVKYINTTSFRLLATERVHLTRSAMFVAITSFKLVIHMIADYSLYWLLMTIRYHGSSQTPITENHREPDIEVIGTGPLAKLIKTIFRSLDLSHKLPSTVSCLPNPNPPDMRRYKQIGFLIFLLWFFVLFEPYGLRLRHVVMGHYQPERAKARALWLYNHLLRCRGSFLKFARRKLHRRYKYSRESKLTFRNWLIHNVPCGCLRSLLGLSAPKPVCLLCNTLQEKDKSDTQLTKCCTEGCPGVYCVCCYTDIGELCTICLEPVDYGDLSDVSLEKGSSDEGSDGEMRNDEKYDDLDYSINSDDDSCEDCSKSQCFGPDFQTPKKHLNVFTRIDNRRSEENIPLLSINKIEKNDAESAEIFSYKKSSSVNSKIIEHGNDGFKNDKTNLIPLIKDAIQKTNSRCSALQRKRRKIRSNSIHIPCTRKKSFKRLSFWGRLRKIIRRLIFRKRKRSKTKCKLFQRSVRHHTRRPIRQFKKNKIFHMVYQSLNRTGSPFSLRACRGVDKIVDTKYIAKCYDKPRSRIILQKITNMDKTNTKVDNVTNKIKANINADKYNEAKKKNPLKKSFDTVGSIKTHLFGEKLLDLLYSVWMKFRTKLNPLSTLTNCLTKKYLQISNSRTCRKKITKIQETETVEDQKEFVKYNEFKSNVRNKECEATVMQVVNEKNKDTQLNQSDTYRFTTHCSQRCTCNDAKKCDRRICDINSFKAKPADKKSFSTDKESSSYTITDSSGLSVDADAKVFGMTKTMKIDKSSETNMDWWTPILERHEYGSSKEQKRRKYTNLQTIQ